MLSRILVANRGEIAARIIRTVHDLGLEAVAIYSDADSSSPAVELADQAYCLGDGGPTETYMDLDKILGIAHRSGADAIHPGYGFLSEHAAVADAVAAAGLTWIGPTGATIEKLGDKISARNTAVAAGVSPVPGTHEPIADIASLRDFAAKVGFPIVAKRADGGGGRGISILRSATDIDDFEARHSGIGGDLQDYFIEKFVENGRHVETQCMRDAQGNFAIVSTRDCSVQRRNQKIVEEAPAPFLSPAATDTLYRWSEALFHHTGYLGLGTCEFLVAGDDVYFLEVNPRLQVEHTVSEEITGLDLVATQLRIAEGHALPEVPASRGHSLELRITSEDPAADLAPTSGTITELAWPTGHGVRVETGVRCGDMVSAEFDSMIAKLIITGTDRPNCLARARRALRELRIEGVTTPVAVLDDILRHPDFAAEQAADFTVGTTWLERKFWPNLDIPPAAAPATQAHTSTAVPLHTMMIELDGKRHELRIPVAAFGAPAAQKKTQPRRESRIRNAPQAQAGGIGPDGVLASPMQAIVVRIMVEPGQQVAEGDVLLVLEAMKMEKFVHATQPGVVEKIHTSTGTNVTPGTPLLTVTTNAMQEA